MATPAHQLWGSSAASSTRKPTLIHRLDAPLQFGYVSLFFRRYKSLNSHVTPIRFPHAKCLALASQLGGPWKLDLEATSPDSMTRRRDYAGVGNRRTGEQSMSDFCPPWLILSSPLPSHGLRGLFPNHGIGEASRFPVPLARRREAWD